MTEQSDFWPHQRLAARALWLRGALDALPPFYDPDADLDQRLEMQEAYRKAVNALSTTLLEQGAGLRHTNNTCQMALLGVRVSCTAGLVGACKNWLTRVDALLAEAQLASAGGDA